MTRNEALEAMRLRREEQPGHWSMFLMCADIMAAFVDDLVYRKVIDARSPLADARLDYCEPFSREVVEAIVKPTE